MSEAEYMEDGADYLEEGCQRQTCDGCIAYNYCLIKEQESERFGSAGMGGENVVNLDNAIEIVKAGGNS